MSVYVDDAFLEGDRWGHWKGGGHMQADTREELLRMADLLGLRRSWLQTKPGRPWRDHYDLTSIKRDLAIALGAVPITSREAARRNIAARKAHQGRSGAASAAIATAEPGPAASAARSCNE